MTIERQALISSLSGNSVFIKEKNFRITLNAGGAEFAVVVTTIRADKYGVNGASKKKNHSDVFAHRSSVLSRRPFDEKRAYR